MLNISKSDKQDLSRAFLNAAKQYYKNPLNMAAFEEWKKKKESNDTENNEAKGNS